MFTKKKEEKLNNEISSLKAEINDLRNIVKTQELERLRQENAMLKEKEKLINNLKGRIRLKDVIFSEESNKVIVKYDLPYAYLDLDADGNVAHFGDFNKFYSINALQLLGLKDLEKIQNLLKKVKEKTL